MCSLIGGGGGGNLADNQWRCLGKGGLGKDAKVSQGQDSGVNHMR